MTAFPLPDGSHGEGPSRGRANAGSNSQASNLSALSIHNCTPAANRRRAVAEETDAYADDPVIEARRNKIVEALDGKIQYVSSSKIVNILGLSELHSNFKNASQDLFADIAALVPARSGKHLIYPPAARSEMANANVADMSGKSLYDSERALTAHFQWLWRRMRVADKSNWPDLKRESAFKYIDFQSRAVAGSKTKPDGLFIPSVTADESYETAHIVLEAKWSSYKDRVPPKTIGQIGDYALQVWAEQPTRVFVPIFLLHGGKLSLAVSTRSGLIIAPLGLVISANGDVTDHPIIKDTLQRLWFFTTLRASEFGHVCDIPDEFSGFAIAKPKDDGTTGLSLTTLPTGEGVADISMRIPRPVRILRRASYMYKVVFEGKAAVLKLTWVPVNRLPEGAAYQLLEESCKGMIPDVYASGIIKHDQFGYRLEFLVIEDCGITIDKFAKLRKSDPHRQGLVEQAVLNAIKQSSACIAKAYAAGVLHRDISAGNIAIKGGVAKVIDWGYSKLRDDMDIEGLGAIERRWRIERDEVAEEESRHDSITGTTMFMSIQVLLGASSRALIHDAESLFYVALYALAVYNGTVDADDQTKPLPLGFCNVENRVLAAARIGCLVSSEDFLSHFGVPNCLPATSMALNSMHSFLFSEDGKFIAGDFLSDVHRQRYCDPASASGFMDATLLPLSVVAADPPSLTHQTSRVRGMSLNADDNDDETSDNRGTKRPRNDE